MAKCTVCGRNAGLLLSMCETCIAEQNAAAQAKQQRLEEARAEQYAHVKCAACGVPMEFMGQLPMRTGGVGGGWHMLAGDWAEMGEGLLPLDLFRCRECRRVEFFDLDLSLRS